MLATGFIGEHLFDYLVPLIAILAYGIMSTKKKQKNVPAQIEQRLKKDREIFPHPPPFSNSDEPLAADMYSIEKKACAFQSSIDQHQFESSMMHRHFNLSTIQEKSASFFDDCKPEQTDPAYALKQSTGCSRARKLIKNKSSLRDAFLLQEILKRPYE